MSKQQSLRQMLARCISNISATRFTLTINPEVRIYRPNQVPPKQLFEEAAAHITGYSERPFLF